MTGTGAGPGAVAGARCGWPPRRLPGRQGGAALDQILIASTGAAARRRCCWSSGGHRTGRITALARLARLAERGPGRGLPGWAALPLQVALPSLLIALLGMYWDISCTSRTAATRARSPTSRTTRS